MRGPVAAVVVVAFFLALAVMATQSAPTPVSAHHCDAYVAGPVNPDDDDCDGFNSTQNIPGRASEPSLGTRAQRYCGTTPQTTSP